MMTRLLKKVCLYSPMWLLVTLMMPSMPFGIQAQVAGAQACSVSVSIATAATASSSCFIPANNKATVTALTGFIGQAFVQRSRNNGLSWANEMTLNPTATTTSTTYITNIQTYNSLVRVFINTISSGTATATIIFNPVLSTRLTYTTVPIGSVAFGSFGNNNAVGSASKLEVADLIIPSTAPNGFPTTGYSGPTTPPGSGFQSTGCGILIGATTGTNLVICQLYDSSGNLVANTATAGTLTGAANAFQQIAWTTGVFLPSGHYYLAIQMNGTTDTYRSVAASTFVDVVAAELNAVSASFGTLTTAITPPVTFTSNKGPIGYVY